MNNTLEDVIIVAEKVAPILAGYLGGPMASAVVNILMTKYGIQDKTDYSSLVQNITNDPMKLQELEFHEREQVGASLVGLLTIVENRASNGLLWLLGIVFGIAFLGYLGFLLWMALS